MKARNIEFTRFHQLFVLPKLSEPAKPLRDHEPTHKSFSLDNMISVTGGYKKWEGVRKAYMWLQELEGVTEGDKGLQGVEKGNKVLHGVTGGRRGYTGWQGVTKGYMGLQMVRWGYKGLQGVTRGYKKLQERQGGDKALQGVTRG